jgi:uncharacterized membrane protein YsdA (DUF1294 family)
MVPTEYLAVLLGSCAIVNGSAFLLFASDKRRAHLNRWRIPEKALLISAFFGPFGAFAAMQLFRHKTRKAKFRLVPAFLLLQTAVIMYLAIDCF